MIIEWSDEDQVFVVSLPEFGPYAKTHGETYEEAVRMGRECLESLIDAYQADGESLPEPARYRGTVAV
jgi:predicted RNase H-like HicB family nuclease